MDSAVDWGAYPLFQKRREFLGQEAWTSVQMRPPGASLDSATKVCPGPKGVPCTDDRRSTGPPDA